MAEQQVGFVMIPQLFRQRVESRRQLSPVTSALLICKTQVIELESQRPRQGRERLGGTEVGGASDLSGV